jgi:hypothetical protein
MAGGIKFLILAWGEWSAERKNVVFVLVVESVFDALGASDLDEKKS